MPNYRPAIVTIDLVEYEDMKRRIAEIDDTVMHREVIAALLNSAAKNLPHLGNTGFPVLYDAINKLKNKNIILMVTAQIDGIGKFTAEEIKIERFKN